jgi:hypothetical protein
MTLPLYFIHGCRSGSTLLCNLLAQNPANHVTPTNDLAGLIGNVQGQWTGCDNFKAQGIEKLTPRIRMLLRGMIHGFYAWEFPAGKAVFDKSRDWINKIELMEDILEQRVTVVLCVRDIRDVVASLEKLFRENQISKPARNAQQQLGGQTIKDRCTQYLAKDAMLGQTICAINDCFEKGLSDRLIVVPYHALVADPVGTVSRIHVDCGLPDFQCDPSVVEYKTVENDEVHGRPFHAIRPEVDSEAIGRWKQYLPEEVANWLDSEYRSIQELAHGNYRNCSHG